MHRNSRRRMLQEFYAMVCHNLMCYSFTLAMDSPKKGFEAEWGDAKEKVQLLKQMLQEFPDKEGKSLYIGRIDHWIKHKDACYCVFEIASPAFDLSLSPLLQIFRVEEDIYEVWKDSAEMRQERFKEDKPDLLKVRVKKGSIYNIEWMEEWDK